MNSDKIRFYYQGDEIKEHRSPPPVVDGVSFGHPNTHPFHITRGGQILPFQTGSLEITETGDGELYSRHFAAIPTEWFYKVNIVEIIV